MNAITKPTAISSGPLAVRGCDAARADLADRRGHRRDRQEEREPAAAARSSRGTWRRRSSRRIATRRESAPAPGRRRSRAHAPATCDRVAHAGARPNRSATSITMRADASATATTAGVRSARFDVVVEQQRRPRRPAGCRRRSAASAAPGGRRRGAAPTAAPRDHRADLGAEERHIAASVPRWSATSNARPNSGRFPAEEAAREDQVRRARDRQELGESLNDPEQ